MAESQVREKSYPAYIEGEGGKIRQNKRGELIVNDWKQQAAMDGFAYTWSNLTPATLITGATSYDPTHPGFFVSVPAGVTFLPTYVGVSQISANSSDNWVVIGFDEDDLDASTGGTDGSAINNMKTDGPKSKVENAKNGDSAITITDPGATERICFHYVDAFKPAATKDAYHIEWKPRVSPVLVGPSTFFTYVHGAKAQEYEYTMQWIEIPTACV